MFKKNKYKLDINSKFHENDKASIANETDIFDIFDNWSCFVNYGISDVELCELFIFQNFNLVNMNLSQFLNEVYLD